MWSIPDSEKGGEKVEANWRIVTGLLQPLLLDYTWSTYGPFPLQRGARFKRAVASAARFLVMLVEDRKVYISIRKKASKGNN